MPNSTELRPVPGPTFIDVRHIQGSSLAAYHQQCRSANGANAPGVRIDGRWRETLDVFTCEEEAEAALGGGEYADSIRALFDSAAVDGTVVVRYVVEEESTTSEVADGVAKFHAVDLVEVQTAAGDSVRQKALCRFTQQIAEMRTDGDDDGKGGEYVMENVVDAWETVHSLVHEARTLLGMAHPLYPHQDNL